MPDEAEAIAHDDAGNDGSEQRAAPVVEPADDGSNVVTVDFGRKK